MYDVVTLIFSGLQTLALFITFLIMAYVAVRQLRAYVYPRVKGIKHFRLTDPIEITVELRNARQTPARDCESSGVVFVATLPLDDNSKMPEPAESLDYRRHSKTGIYPQGELTFNRVSIDLLNDAKLIDGVRSGRAAIYVAGEARYRDMFKLKRRTESCYIDPDHTRALVDDAQGRPAAVSPIINFVTAHVWNRAT